MKKLLSFAGSTGESRNLTHWIRRLNRRMTITLAFLLLTGCAAGVVPTTGFLFSNVKGPLMVVNGEGQPTKIGQASARSIFGLISVGDASIAAAVKNGNITRIYYVDYYTKVLLGIIAETTIIVYGD